MSPIISLDPFVSACLCGRQTCGLVVLNVPVWTHTLANLAEVPRPELRAPQGPASLAGGQVDQIRPKMHRGAAQTWQAYRSTARQVLPTCGFQEPLLCIHNHLSLLCPRRNAPLTMQRRRPHPVPASRTKSRASQQAIRQARGEHTNNIYVRWSANHQGTAREKLGPFSSPGRARSISHRISKPEPTHAPFRGSRVRVKGEL